MRSSIYISHHPEGERQGAAAIGFPVVFCDGLRQGVFLWRGGCGGWVAGWLWWMAAAAVAVAGGGPAACIGGGMAWQQNNSFGLAGHGGGCGLAAVSGGGEAGGGPAYRDELISTCAFFS